MKTPKRKTPWFRTYYDRAAACLVLAALLGSVVYLTVRYRSDSRKETGLDKPVPAHPGVASVSVERYKQAATTMEKPREFIEFLITKPPRRVSCSDCLRPIPLDEYRERKPCPFCKRIPPPAPPTADYDDDGIHDKWEREFGLDPNDPTDAVLDPDGDGFTSREEFQNGRTSPIDADEVPIAQTVYVEKIIQKAIPILFSSVAGERDGNLIFQLNTPDMTYFKKLGDRVSGYRIVAYTPKSQRGFFGGILRTVDLSELTLEKDGKQIVLVRDQPYYKHGVRIGQRLDGIAHHAAVGHQLEIRGHRFTVTGFDAASSTAVIRRIKDSREWTIGASTSTVDRTASVQR